MNELPKRTLGRTGFEVTTLGYGAMELRGAPAGPENPSQNGIKLSMLARSATAERLWH